MKPLAPSRLRLLAFLLVSAAAANAAPPPRIFVSSAGKDSNDGSATSPKRYFQAAHDALADGGEIIAVDVAGYGPLTITKSITISAPKPDSAFVTAASGKNAIIINAGASGEVTLRGLSLTSKGGNFGVLVQAASLVHLIDCRVSGFSVGVLAGSDGLSTATLSLSHCILRDCQTGLATIPSDQLYGTIDGCQFVNDSSVGANLTAGTHMAVRKCLFARNGAGLQTGDNTETTVQECMVSNNTAGISAGATMTVDNSTIINNSGRGVYGSAYSYGNNTMADNNPDGAFAGSYTGQ